MSTKAEQCEYSCVRVNGWRTETRGAVLGAEAAALRAGSTRSPSLQRRAGGLCAHRQTLNPLSEPFLSAGEQKTAHTSR